MQRNHINKFPGYSWERSSVDNKMHNMYKGEDVGLGGLVWAIPGMYGPSLTLDVSGMHPTSLIELNYFGRYTPRYEMLVDTRQLIKHKQLEEAMKMFDGKLEKWLRDADPSISKGLTKALKLAQNACYGETYSRFENPMRDSRNVNNIVALRGALFMAMLKDEVINMGYHVFHIKTDSIKVANYDDKIVNYIIERGKEYGYKFEVEHKFEKICLINNAIYIAKLAKDDPEAPGTWSATGAQFAEPYVFKTLFSKEQVTFDDLCQTKSVKDPYALYLDFNEGLGEDQHNYQFIGKVGLFTPVKEGCGGGNLVSMKKDKTSAAQGTKGTRWKEASIVKSTDTLDTIDYSYFNKLVDKAKDAISKFGDVEWFVSDDENEPDSISPCGAANCNSCEQHSKTAFDNDCAEGYDISEQIINGNA